jgi:hypothetical protein
MELRPLTLYHFLRLIPFRIQMFMPTFPVEAGQNQRGTTREQSITFPILRRAELVRYRSTYRDGPRRRVLDIRKRHVGKPRNFSNRKCECGGLGTSKRRLANQSNWSVLSVHWDLHCRKELHRKFSASTNSRCPIFVRSDINGVYSPKRPRTVRPAWSSVQIVHNRVLFGVSIRLIRDLL